MTVDEIIVQALARGQEFSVEFPKTKSVHIRRINTRQQQLFVRAAEINVDYFGKSVSVPLVAGAADLTTLNPAAERIDGVRVNGVGTSGYFTGAKVTVVPIADAAMSGLPPRATLRDYTLTGYGTDLDLVASVWIDYSKRPAELTAGADVPQLPAQFHELLVIDDAKSMFRRTLSIDAAKKKEIIDTLEAEEAEYMADFERHVERFQLAEQARFGRTGRPVATPQGTA